VRRHHDIPERLRLAVGFKNAQVYRTYLGIYPTSLSTQSDVKQRLAEDSKDLLKFWAWL